MRFHGADLVFTEGATREIAKIALQQGTGARGLRSVMEEILEGVLFEVESGVKYVITQETIEGCAPIKSCIAQKEGPLRWHLSHRPRFAGSY